MTRPGRRHRDRDPVYASTRFYQALALVPAWDTLPITIIAQEVQGSGYPDAYAKWETLADALVATFNGTAVDCRTSKDTEQGQPGSRRA